MYGFLIRCSIFLSRSDTEETEAREDDLHARPAGRAGEPVRQDALPRHLHARGGGPEDQPARVPRAGGPRTLSYLNNAR